MKFRIFPTLVCMIVLSVSVGFAHPLLDKDKELYFDHFQKEDGLIDMSISSIVQDEDGYMWFGSQGGLLQFNGERSKSYRNNPFDEDSLPNNLVQTTYYDENKNILWLGTYYGVSKFDIDTQQFINYSSDNSNLSNNVIITITKDASGDLWFGTMDGLNKLDPITNEIITYPVEGNVVRSLLVDSHERLLVGTYSGLFIFDEPTQDLKKIDIEYPSLYVMTVNELDDGIITIGMWDGGLLELDMDFNEIRRLSFEDNRIYTILKTSDDVLWVGTWGGGLFANHEGTTLHFPGTDKEGDIGHPVVYSLLEDSEGMLWIGTNGGGIFRLDRNKNSLLFLKHNPDDPSSLDQGKINTIYQDSKDRLWIAIYNMGLNRVDSKSKKLIKYSSLNEDTQRIHHDQIMDMIEYNNMLLCATGNGISKYDERTDSFTKLNVLPENTTVYTLAVDSDDTLWIGTYFDGVYNFDKEMNLLKVINSKSPEENLEENLVYDLTIDDLGNVWIASNNGLYKYDKSVDHLKSYFKQGVDRTALSSNNTRSLLKDRNGKIWIGTTGGGLSVYNSESDNFTTLTEKNGLIDNTIISIIESDDENIWVATRSGISIIDSQTLNIVNLSEENGLGGSDFTSRGFKDENGSIYFGGTHGVDFIPKFETEIGEDFPPVYITGVSVYHESIDSKERILNGKHFSFDAKENYLSFEFEAIDYRAISSTYYSYKLDGVDSDWVEGAQRNFASYSNIPPGQYEFLVRVKNIQGAYSEPVSLNFAIAVPWYKTEIAYAVYLLIAASFMYVVLKIREGQLISQRNSELSSLNHQLNEVVSELESISIRDPITGGFNRRYFDTTLKEYIQIAKRSQESITLMMMDVDNFKDVNDTHGHVFGDHFLNTLSEIIVSSLPRSTDFVARFGGDEFAVVLYDTDLDGARVVAERIFDNISNIQVHTNQITVPVHTTLSMGVYSSEVDKNSTVDHYVECADKMLYKVKNTGKNRIEYYT